MMAAKNKEIGVPLSILLRDVVPGDILVRLQNISVQGLAYDSRQVKPGFIFIALAGSRVHGLEHAVEAVNKGAVAVLWDEYERADEIVAEISKRVVCIQCAELQTRIGDVADRFYDHPSSKLKVIGVTGTDGKTSVTHFIAQCLDGVKGRCGILGTLGNGFPGELTSTGLTTAPVIDVHRDLMQMLNSKAEYVAMEVSSHGLDQGRVNAVKFDTAVFTNLSQDHIDYHGSMENYAAAKMKLFTMPGIKTAVVNLDDEFGRKLAFDLRSKVTVCGYSARTDVVVGDEYCDFLVNVTEIKITDDGYKLSVVTPKGKGDFSVALLGSYNVSNVLAVLTVLLTSGMTFEEAIGRIQLLKPVPGRMEVIGFRDKPKVIVDYAHTPNALSVACRSAIERCSGKLWCVFGCGGDRDTQKRPMMAAVAEASCNKVIVTSDNPRHEDAEKIIADILSGFRSKKDVEVILDRKQAIEFAIQNANKEDVILLAGKGHESTQIIGDTHHPFSDSQIARGYLGALA